MRAATQAADDQRSGILERQRAAFLKENPDIETVRVRSARTEVNPDGSRSVVLWERHPLYDGGEIFLTAEPGEWTVLKTERVKRQLQDGILIEVRK